MQNKRSVLSLAWQECFSDERVTVELKTFVVQMILRTKARTKTLVLNAVRVV